MSMVDWSGTSISSRSPQANYFTLLAICLVENSREYSSHISDMLAVAEDTIWHVDMPREYWRLSYLRTDRFSNAL